MSVALPVLPATSLRLTPTDVSQFVRLEQCERFLRLRLAERAGYDFMSAYGVAVQRITPLMTLSGSEFETTIETHIGTQFRAVNFATLAGKAHNRSANNAEVLVEARGLKPGETVLLFQTRLDVTLGDWRLRGDVELRQLVGGGAVRPAVVRLTGRLETGGRVRVGRRA